jgi:hypothetical protein
MASVPDTASSGFPPEGATRAQILVALGIMNLCTRVRGDHGVLTARAGQTFDALLNLAVKAGLSRKEKRLFIGGLRAGKASPCVMARAEHCVELIGPAAFHQQLRRHAAWEHIAATGRLPPGWTWGDPASATGTTTTGAHQ